MNNFTAPFAKALIIAAAGLACATASAAGHHQSGITGQVLLYSCPVVFPGANCYRPYQTSFVVETESGRFVTTVMSGPHGRFEAFLKPGDYVLVADPATQPFPFLKPLAVHVDKKQFTTVTVVFDSGIR